MIKKNTPFRAAYSIVCFSCSFVSLYFNYHLLHKETVLMRTDRGINLYVYNDRRSSVLFTFNRVMGLGSLLGSIT